MARKKRAKLEQVLEAAEATLMPDRSGRGRRRGLVGGAIALGVGAAVAGAVAAERSFVRRDRKRPDPYWDEPYGRLRGRSIGPVASSDGTLLNVEEAGNAGPTIVFAHGFSLNLTLWHHQIKELSADHRLILYDHRGHGRSGLPPSDEWSLEALARDLDAVIRDTSAGEPVVVVGHSMGGMTALKYCELFPDQIGRSVAGLVLVDTTSADVMGGMLPGMARRVEAAFQGAQNLAWRVIAGNPTRMDRLRKGVGDLAYLGTRLMGFGPSPSPAQVTFVDRMLREVPSDVWIKLIPAMLGHDVDEALPALDVPTLVIVGDRDKLTPLDAARRIARAIPGAGLVVMEGTGHTPMLEKHVEFNRHVRRFVARVHAHASRR